MEYDQQDTTFIYAFLYCDMDMGIIMEVPELLFEAIVTGIMAKSIAKTTYNSCKANLGSVVKPVNHFAEEEAGHFFVEILHISIQLVIHCYTICILYV